MFGPLEQLKTYAIIGLGVALLLAVVTATIGIHYYRSEYLVEHTTFESFKTQVAALGEQAKFVKKLEEKGYEIRITDSDTKRADALRLLAKERASRGGVQLTPPATEKDGTISFDQKALSAAVERYRDRVLGVAEEGDKAQIDAEALLNGWPRKER